VRPKPANVRARQLPTEVATRSTPYLTGGRGVRGAAPRGKFDLYEPF